mgnify:CR=1 FL=1
MEILFLDSQKVVLSTQIGRINDINLRKTPKTIQIQKRRQDELVSHKPEFLI